MHIQLLCPLFEKKMEHHEDGSIGEKVAAKMRYSYAIDFSHSSEELVTTNLVQQEDSRLDYLNRNSD